MKNKFGDIPVSDFREYGHQLVDWITDYLDKIEKYPMLPKTEADKIKNG